LKSLKKNSSGSIINQFIMKNISVLIIGLSLILAGMTGICSTKADNPTGAPNQGSAKSTIDILSSSELSNLATSWAIEYGKLNPGIKVNVNGMTGDQPSLSGQIILATDDDIEMPATASQWKMVVGRDAVVAIINVHNPMLKEIDAEGVSPDEFAGLFSDQAKGNWKNMITNGQNVPINYYFMESENVKENMAHFAGIDLRTINGKMVANSAEIISAIQNDQYAIGFCRLTNVFDAGTKELVQGIQLLPIDKNQNGRVDNFENIYTNTESFTRGIWIGKYPRALCSNLYALSASQPTEENTVAFLTWITTQGQKYLNNNGLSDLTSAEIKSNMAALAPNRNVEVKDVDNTPFISNNWLAAIVFLGLSAFILLSVLSYGKKQNWEAADKNTSTTVLLNEDVIAAPKGLYFDKTHTWAFMEQDGHVKIGIDDFLQHVTGTLSRIIMKNTGEKVRKGDKILTIVKDGKQLSIYAPISGTILKHNTTLLSNTSLINSSPYSEGWIYEIEPANWLREIRFLFMGERYKEWIEDEFVRLKDFFAATAKSKTPAYAHLILQDGGELADHILANQDPEVWEEFQIKFINTSK